MTKKYADSALFVYTRDTEHIIDNLENNSFGVKIESVEYDELMKKPGARLENVHHVVVSAPLRVLKTVIQLGIKYKYSIGIIPKQDQKNLIDFYELPADLSEAIELALRKDGQPLDIVLCNGKVLLFKAVVGQIPVIDKPEERHWLRILQTVFKKLFKLRLFTYEFSTYSNQDINTAACGCMLLKQHRNVFYKRILNDFSSADGMISLIIFAPISIVEYFKLIAQSFKSSAVSNDLPDSVGYIKSPRINIQPETALDVVIDDEDLTVTPLQCESLSGAFNVNIGRKIVAETGGMRIDNERINIDNLPNKNELLKAKRHRRVPFFSYASSERFRDLMSALRDDALINIKYIVLMVLSTFLATIGLYLDSPSVIIGAMLLAPLMAPIVSLSMGMLRGDSDMFQKSIIKIVAGTLIALFSSALISLLFPDKPVTNEMLNRLNPTLLDLMVAVVSGFAAAYSKSFREIIQNLAGVAIAVALVPPLSVAGIGLGRLDPHFFFQAFLLFSSNLVGIVVAGTCVFRVLGYSAALRKKRSFTVVIFLLLLISIPLYFSYHQIIEERALEKSWQHERFLVNMKYLVVQKADIRRQGDRQIVTVNVLAREHLTRSDLNAFKNKIKKNFNKKLILRVNTTYIP